MRASEDDGVSNTDIVSSRHVFKISANILETIVLGTGQLSSEDQASITAVLGSEGSAPSYVSLV